MHGALCSHIQTSLLWHFFFFWIWRQVDNVSSIQRKTYGLALSIILTLRLPQVLNKLDQILRYELTMNSVSHLLCDSWMILFLRYDLKMILIYTCSVCTTVILGGNDDLAEESRLVPVRYYLDVFFFVFVFSRLYNYWFINSTPINNSGDNISSSGSLSKDSIPSKEFRRRQVNNSFSLLYGHYTLLVSKY